MPLISFGLSDIGQKRSTNQDSIYVGKEERLYIVADGMGGHNGGDIASQTAVKVMPSSFAKFKGEKFDQRLKKSLLAANVAIYQKSLEDAKLKGMGTTLVALSYHENKAYLANVGDSRAYLVHKGMLYQLTRDHSLVQEKINLGIYSRSDGNKDKMKNVLIRSVGFEPKVEIDIFNYKVHRNDIFLLCSDGLHGKVSDEDILNTINENIPDPATATEQNLQTTVMTLIKMANEHGGEDNISVVMSLAK